MFENILSILSVAAVVFGPDPLAITVQLPASPYSNPFADELTFNAFPAAPIASLSSALAPLTIISP